MGSVTIDGNPYEIYGTLAEATVYINGIPDLYAAWAALSTDNKGRYLRKSFLTLSVLPWADGVVPATTQDIVDASYLLAGILAVNPGAMGGPGGGPSVQGAVAEVSDTTRRARFFYSADAAAARTSPIDALPREVRAMINQYLAQVGSGGVGKPVAFGTDGESVFSESFELSD